MFKPENFEPLVYSMNRWQNLHMLDVKFPIDFFNPLDIVIIEKKFPILPTVTTVRTNFAALPLGKLYPMLHNLKLCIDSHEEYDIRGRGSYAET